VGDPAREAPAAVRTAARHRPSALHRLHRFAAVSWDGARTFDSDTHGESVTGQPLDLFPRTIDSVLLARLAHHVAHVLTTAERGDAGTPELGVVGHQVGHGITVTATHGVTEFCEELIDVVHSTPPWERGPPVRSRGT